MRKYTLELKERKHPENIEEEVQAFDFPNWIQAHQKALRSYCRSLAGSTWEGDDLAQDTWLKIWSSLRNKRDGISLSRAYLYRAARNAWIDRGRKRTLPADSKIVEELPQQQPDGISLWVVMDTLVSQLVPNQRVALLLVDVLQYTAAEAAELIQSTEGAVKAALHRARVKLRGILEQSDDDDEPKFSESNNRSGLHEAIVYAYLDAVRRQDASALAILLNDPSPQDLVPTLTLQSYRQNRAPLPGAQTSKTVKSQWITMSLAA